LSVLTLTRGRLQPAASARNRETPHRFAEEFGQHGLEGDAGLLLDLFRGFVDRGDSHGLLQAF